LLFKGNTFVEKEMRTTVSRVIVLAVVLLFACTVVSAAPIEWPVSQGGNGHLYELVYVAVDWETARSLASNMNLSGYVSYLATITSQAEQNFVYTQLVEGKEDGFFIGGYQDLNAPDYSEPGGGWRWITGEPWVYTHWADGEPNNNAEGCEDVAEIAGWYNGGWNDVRKDVLRYYMVEYEPVPEPSAVFVLVSGIGSLLMPLRRLVR
jgi:hypothetical protein